MRQLAAQRRPGVGDHAVRGDRQQFLAEPPGGKAEREIDQAIDHQQPHRGEVPQQRAAEPAAEGEELTVKHDGSKVWIIDAKGGQSMVTISNVNQSNGVIHVVDTVLLPAS